MISKISNLKFAPRVVALLATCCLLLSFSTGCSSSSLARNADRVATALLQSQPIFQSLIDGGVIPGSRGAQIIARLTEGARDAKALADAFRSGNNADAVDTAARLINVFETIISQDTLLISNPAQRTTVLAILAAADIALHIIADNLIKTAQANARAFDLVMAWAPAQAKQSAETIKRFAKKPKLRCRDAKTGRFLKMEQCKASPETTVIERVEKKQ